MCYVQKQTHTHNAHQHGKGIVFDASRSEGTCTILLLCGVRRTQERDVRQFKCQVQTRKVFRTIHGGNTATCNRNNALEVVQKRSKLPCETANHTRNGCSTPVTVTEAHDLGSRRVKIFPLRPMENTATTSTDTKYTQPYPAMLLLKSKKVVIRCDRCKRFEA